MRAAVRRLGLFVGATAAATLVLSLAIGALAGARLSHAIAVGFYSVSAACLVGCLVFGVRGPLRPEWQDEHRRGFMTPRSVRRASPEERSESGRISLLLFAVGMLFLGLAIVIDPNHRLA